MQSLTATMLHKAFACHTRNLFVKQAIYQQFTCTYIPCDTIDLELTRFDALKSGALEMTLICKQTSGIDRSTENTANQVDRWQRTTNL